jgi:glycosyltransferase involved in cell wall biosynthesis
MCRIAYLVSQYPTVNHTYILNEIRDVRRAGLEIEVFSVRAPDRPVAQMTEYERQEVARTHYLLSSGLLRIILDQLIVFVARPIPYLRGLVLAMKWARLDLPESFRHLVYFAEAVSAGRRIQRLSIRRVHTHFASKVALFLAYVFPVEFSMTIHGPDEFTDPDGFLLQQKCAKAKAVIAISHFALSQLVRWSEAADKGKIRVCRLGVTLPDYALSQRQTNQEPLELICVGRLAPVKGHTVLLEAVALLRAENRKIRLRIVGGGPLMDALQEQTRKSGLDGVVIFEGPVNHERVLALYRNADLAVLASFGEGVPVVLMESMATGIPCVATWVNGIPELVRNGIDGLLVAPGDAAGLAAAIGRLLDDPELRARMGRAAREQIAAAYDLEKNNRRLAEILSEVHGE